MQNQEQTPRQVLFIDEPHPFLKSRLREKGFVTHHWPTASRDEIEKALQGDLQDLYGIVIKSRFVLDADFLALAKSLRFVVRVGAGLESIDVEAAKTLGIEVIGSPEGNRDAVGEHTLGMLLSLFNHLNRADREIRNGIWRREPNRGTELMGKTVGIIGYGNMGNAFSRRLQGFGVEVLAYDKFKTNYGNQNAKAVSLEELKERAEVVSFHIPWLPENDLLVDMDYLEGFAKPIWLLNTSRGRILDTSALVEALNSGQVLGAGLDVLEYEDGSFEDINPAKFPEPFHRLAEMDNVLLSPHVAGWTHASNRKHAETLARKILTLG